MKGAEASIVTVSFFLLLSMTRSYSLIHRGLWHGDCGIAVHMEVAGVRENVSLIAQLRGLAVGSLRGGEELSLRRPSMSVCWSGVSSPLYFTVRRSYPCFLRLSSGILDRCTGVQRACDGKLLLCTL